MVLGQLFMGFFRVGLFSVGGGYVLIPLIEKEVVRVYGWLTPEEFIEVLGISQGIPGAISMKFATYTGYRLAGYPGVVAANLGIFLPPVILMFFVSALLLRYSGHRPVKAFLSGIQFATIGMLLSITLNIVRGQSWGVGGVLISVAAASLMILTKVHPGAVIFLAGFVGVFLIRS
jgi:chromate transporter